MTMFTSLEIGINKSDITANGYPVLSVGQIATYSVTPAAISATNIATSQSISGATAAVLTAGTGVTSTTLFTNTVLSLDVPRNVRITSAGDDSGITFAVVGYDVYNKVVRETITGANAGVASGKKAFKYIRSITSYGSTAAAITIGVGDVLGLPFRIADINNVVKVSWASALADDASTVVAAVDSTATATTGDVRGTIVPSSATNATRKLIVYALVDQTSKNTLFGVDQY